MTPISPESLRRRRLLTHGLPVVALALAAFVAGLIVGADSPERDAARLQWDGAEGHTERRCERVRDLPVVRMHAVRP